MGVLPLSSTSFRPSIRLHVSPDVVENLVFEILNQPGLIQIAKGGRASGMSRGSVLEERPRECEIGVLDKVRAGLYGTEPCWGG